MTTCPKCRHTRQPNDTAPEWQCPACGVAYAKAADAGRPAAPAVTSYSASNTPERSGIPWGKLILLAAVVWGGWMGVQAARKHGVAGVMASISGNVSAEAISALAATVKSDEVVMYSTTECTYCAQAKGWLNQYGFAFTECNMSVSKQCESDYLRLGGNGTPFLVLTRNGKTHYMKNGFDSDEFLAALKM